MVNTDALVEALRNNDIAGAGLDVIEGEPGESNSSPPRKEPERQDPLNLGKHQVGDVWKHAVHYAHLFMLVFCDGIVARVFLRRFHDSVLSLYRTTTWLAFTDLNFFAPFP